MSIQLGIILIYFAVTVVIGVVAMRRAKSATAFHGVNLGIFAVVCTSAGEWLGGTATTGVSEYGYDYGISGAWFTIANGIGIVFLALLFARLYRSLNQVTVPGIIGTFLGGSARTVSSVILTFVMLVVGISQMIAAGSLCVSLTGVDFNVAVVAFAAISIVYTLAGGMNAVVSTSKLHLAVLYIGTIVAVVVALGMVGGFAGFKGGIAAVEAAEPGKNYFSMFSIGVPKVTSWIVAGLLGACTAQAGIQPVLASRDVPSARQACIISAFVVAPFGLLTAFLGMIARVMTQQGTLLDQAGSVVTSGKLALPSLMMNMTPAVGGFVMAAILVAIISTVAPVTLAAGTMLTKDIYQGVINKKAGDRQVLAVSRLTTALAGVVCTVVAIVLNSTGIRVLDIVYFAYSMRGSLFIVVLLGIYWKKTSERGAIAGMVCTAIVGLFWVAYNGAVGHFPIHPAITETYASVVVAFVTTVVFTFVFPKKKTLRD